MSSLAEKEEQPPKPDEEDDQPAKKRARTDAAPVTDPEASDDAAPAPAPTGFAAHTSGGFGSFGGSSSGGFGSSSGGGFGGFSGGGFGGFGAAASEEKTGFAAAASDGKTEEKGGSDLDIEADDKTEGPSRRAALGAKPAPAAPEKIDASNGEEGTRSSASAARLCIGEAQGGQLTEGGAYAFLFPGQKGARVVARRAHAHAGLEQRRRRRRARRQSRALHGGHTEKTRHASCASRRRGQAPSWRLAAKARLGMWVRSASSELGLGQPGDLYHRRACLSRRDHDRTHIPPCPQGPKLSIS